MAEWRLELAEEARLYFRGRKVPARKRGLAILALIALGFEARREALAAMLWGHGAALNNLRVELYGLRRWFPGWARGEDPLSLPEGLEVRASARPRLRNLRGLTAELDAWIDRLGSHADAPAVCVTLPPLTPPFVLFVRRLPLTDEEAVVREVRATTALGREALGVLRAGLDFSARKVLAERQKSFLVFLPPYGEDPADLLELRVQLPAERVRYLELEPWSWEEARRRMLEHLPFTEAARVYLAAGGQPGHIAELLALRPPAGFGERVPLPQRVRAAYRRESRYLSMEARISLERFSVHPGILSEELVAALGLVEEVEELERKRWLVYRGGGWVFRHEAGRQVLAGGLEEGRRRLYHRRMAEAFDALGRPWAAAYHALRAGRPRGMPPSRGWAAVVLSGGAPVAGRERPRGGELLIEGIELESGGAEVRGDRVVFVRTPSQPEESAVGFESPEIPSLLRLRGHAYVRNALRVGLEADAIPLYLECAGRRLVFAPLDRPAERDGEAVLPMNGDFEYWIELPPRRRVRLGSRAELGVIELELAFYRVGAAPQAPRVGAYELKLAPAPR